MLYGLIFSWSVLFLFCWLDREQTALYLLVFFDIIIIILLYLSKVSLVFSYIKYLYSIGTFTL